MVLVRSIHMMCMRWWVHITSLKFLSYYLMQILDNNIPTGDTEDYFTSSVVRVNGKVGRHCVTAS